MFMTWRITPNSSDIPLPPSTSRAVRAISSAFPALLRFTSEIISGVARPSSESRLTRSAA